MCSSRRMIMVEVQEVSAADVLASVVSGTAKNRMTAAVRAISYRVPVSSLARVDALASKTGKSRNAILNMLVDAGLEEVFLRLSQEHLEEVQSREMFAIRELLAGE